MFTSQVSNNDTALFVMQQVACKKGWARCAHHKNPLMASTLFVLFFSRLCLLLWISCYHVCYPTNMDTPLASPVISIVTLPLNLKHLCKPACTALLVLVVIPSTASTYTSVHATLSLSHHTCLSPSLTTPAKPPAVPPSWAWATSTSAF